MSPASFRRRRAPRFAAHQEDPSFSSFGWKLCSGDSESPFHLTSVYKNKLSAHLSPLRHRALWLWGVFGAMTVTTYFAAVALVGSGQTAFFGGEQRHLLSPLFRL
ncbi:MAG: hypothetical protein IPL83_14360 [Bdellovibrionales bacterium]|nr:hypothetical protein [Bdellovibrionales bacterium]